MTEATFDNGVVQLYQGDARRVLGELPAESVHCVVTSPPYWGLRDYGLEPLTWGGDEGCEHEWEDEFYQRRSNDNGKTLKQLSNAGANDRDRPIQHAFCACGAWRGSLGLEPTIELYVEHIVEVFHEARRVLRKDGTLWLNMADSYAGSNRGGFADETAARASILRAKESGNTLGQRYSAVYVGTAGGPGLKPKDLCMMPARVALALQADGWWLRSDIVWAKPNPMPESVTDRPTRSHEYLFLLTKASTYYYDADAIREPMSDVTYKRLTQPSFHSQSGGPKDPGEGNRSERRALINQNEKLIRQEKWGSRYIGYEEWKETNAGRNKRSVWEIATEPYPEAHFATFPQKLVEPCVLAGCPVEGTVLDPFVGSGTAVYVAQRLGRRSIGVDLSPEYLALAAKRIEGVSLPMEL